ncbi:unnamed protein product [Trichogramma brassicae]|uniref:Reverse transcriptase zinc-binding domain-containing protein n=1 Tax=Trichogramma brassicae TaxID=86971 RepID=A0A6H5I4G6_9HYME|nr:unnamed protein product [Trichogramma brassicae]
MNCYLTQLLSGHGFFKAYLCRFGHNDLATCPSCPTEDEDAEHVLFCCPRFAPEDFELSRKENLAPCTSNYNDIDSDHSLENLNAAEPELSDLLESSSPMNSSMQSESSEDILSCSPSPEQNKTKPLQLIQQQKIQVRQKQQQQQQQQQQQYYNILSPINENPLSPDLFKEAYDNQEENLRSRQANHFEESYENQVQNLYPRQADHPEENRAEEEDPFTKSFPFVDENHEWQPIGSPELVITELKETGIEFNQYSPERNIPKALPSPSIPLLSRPRGGANKAGSARMLVGHPHLSYEATYVLVSIPRLWTKLSCSQALLSEGGDLICPPVDGLAMAAAPTSAGHRRVAAFSDVGDKRCRHVLRVLRRRVRYPHPAGVLRGMFTLSLKVMAWWSPLWE